VNTGVKRPHFYGHGTSNAYDRQHSGTAHPYACARSTWTWSKLTQE